MSNMHLYWSHCALSNGCSLVTYANARGSAVLTYFEPSCFMGGNNSLALVINSLRHRV